MTSVAGGRDPAAGASGRDPAAGAARLAAMVRPVCLGVRRYRRAGAMLGLCVALTGCLGLGGGKPPAQFYTLTPDAPPAAGSGASAGPSASGPTAVAVPGTAAVAVIPAPVPANVVIVSEPTAARALEVTRIPVAIDPTRIAYLKDAVWAERPTALFRNLLVETLRGDDHLIVLADDDPAARGGVRLSGQLLAMGYDKASGGVVVRYEALRSTARGSYSSRLFAATVPDVPPAAGPVADAVNRAANQVAHDVATWLRQPQG